MKSWLAIVLVVGCLHQGLSAFRVICVYTNWSQYRPDIGKFLPEDVDPSLCTHLIYVYAKLQGNKLVAAEWNDVGTAWSEGMFDRVQNLKQMNPELKTLLGVGGWMMGSKDFSRMASRPGYRRIFATTAVKYLREHDFNGLAIDWQYPTRRGGKPYDKKNFSLLLKEIRKAIDSESKRSKLPSLLLSVGVSASKEIIDNAYEIENITRYTDFINVLAYDLHGAWDNYTGHPSQLYPRKEEFGPSIEVNVDAVMKYWISNVPERSKLNLGISTYGRSFTLRKERHNEYNVPAKGPGLAGEYTKQPGMLAYYERCSQFSDAVRVWDDVSKVAYWYKGDQWMAGEDVESVKAKVNWMRRSNIGGLMYTSFDMDDFSGAFCGGEIYPLLMAINDQLTAPLPTLTLHNTRQESVLVQPKQSAIDAYKPITRTIASPQTQAPLVLGHDAMQQNNYTSERPSLSTVHTSSTQQTTDSVYFYEYITVYENTTSENTSTSPTLDTTTSTRLTSENTTDNSHYANASPPPITQATFPNSIPSFKEQVKSAKPEKSHVPVGSRENHLSPPSTKFDGKYLNSATGLLGDSQLLNNPVVSPHTSLDVPLRRTQDYSTTTISTETLTPLPTTASKPRIVKEKIQSAPRVFLSPSRLTDDQIKRQRLMNDILTFILGHNSFSPRASLTIGAQRTDRLKPVLPVISLEDGKATHNQFSSQKISDILQTGASLPGKVRQIINGDRAFSRGRLGASPSEVSATKVSSSKQHALPLTNTHASDPRLTLNNMQNVGIGTFL